MVTVSGFFHRAELGNTFFKILTTGEDVEKREPLHCWWECRLVQPLWKAVWRYLKKLKMDSPFNPEIPLLGIYPKEPKTLIRKHISTPMSTAALLTTTKTWKQPKCPSPDEWIKLLWDIYTKEFYLAINNKKILPFATYGWTWRTVC